MPFEVKKEENFHFEVLYAVKLL